jgi:hypothetical protein
MFSSGLGPYSTRFLRRVFWLYVVLIVAVCVSVGVGKLGTPTLVSFAFFGALLWLGDIDRGCDAQLTRLLFEFAVPNDFPATERGPRWLPGLAPGHGLRAWPKPTC